MRRMHKRKLKEIALAYSNVTRAKGEHETRRRQLSDLQAAVTSIDDVLVNLGSTYRAACAAAETQFEAAIRLYWTTNTRRTMKDARKFEREWRKASLRAVKKGRAAAERPEASVWTRPKSQDAPLPFQRPVELQ